VASTETAQVVREAAFAACREERQAVLEVHRRYKDEFFDEGVLDKVDEQMAGPVLLEIIKMRAAKPPTSGPSAQSPRTPI
jgi:hypothetical protein